MPGQAPLRQSWQLGRRELAQEFRNERSVRGGVRRVMHRPSSSPFEEPSRSQVRGFRSRSRRGGSIRQTEYSVMDVT